MQKHLHKNDSILIINENEFFNNIVLENYPFRKLKNIINFPELLGKYRSLYSNLGQTGIDIEKGFKALLIQFWEDYSDRQMERCINENMAIRWFCGFRLNEKTPDHSYFSKLRKRIGENNLSNIFNEINNILRNHGLFGDIFKFIDASSIITKNALWEERDKALAAGEEKLNNTNVEKYVADKDARWGNKGGNNFWFGYKRHACVDRKFGLIDNIIITAANVMDYDALKHICPKNCKVFADKLYDCKTSYMWLLANNCHSGIIKKRNNKDKNKDLDKWNSKLRMPHESTFSKLNKRARYRGKNKVSFQCVFESIAFNLKKAIRVLTPLLEA